MQFFSDSFDTALFSFATVKSMKGTLSVPLSAERSPIQAYSSRGKKKQDHIFMYVAMCVAVECAVAETNTSSLCRDNNERRKSNHAGFLTYQMQAHLKKRSNIFQSVYINADCDSWLVKGPILCKNM